MNNFIPLSQLNDFIFCPYSIYLHNVYMNTDEGLYQAYPQIRGKKAHTATDRKTGSNRSGDLLALPVCSIEFGIQGKIDLYRTKEQELIERKYSIKQIYRGQLYQLWGEYYCMKEMGYDIKTIAFYEISTHKKLEIPLPSEREKRELKSFILRFKEYDPTGVIPVNTQKCRHCIYCNLCDKTSSEHVY